MRTSRPPRCFGIVFCSPPRQQAYPSLRLDMRETQTAVLTGELIAGDLDCVLLALPVKHADVETAALFRDRFLFLPRLQQDAPSLRLDMRETQTAVLTGELIAGDLDCVLLALPVKHADVETAALFRDRF